MSEYLGIHLGLQALWAVRVDGQGVVQQHLSVPRSGASPRACWTPDEAMGALAQIEQAAPVRRCVAALSLPAQWVCFRRVATPADGGDEAVRFALEPLTPQPVENLRLAVCDRDRQSAGVWAAATAPWAQILEAMDARGWLCIQAGPDAMAMWALASRHRRMTEGLHLLALADATQGFVLAVRGDKVQVVHALGMRVRDAASPAAWMGDELHRLAWGCGGQSWDALVIGAPTGLADGCEAGEPAIDRLAWTTLVKGSLPGQTGALLAYAAAVELVSGAARANFRSGSWRSQVARRIAGKLGWMHSAAAMAMCLTLAGGLVWQGKRCQAQQSQYARACQATWANLYPGVGGVSDVESRLRSEWAREKALRRQGSQLPRYDKALDGLRNLMAAMPADVPVRMAQVALTREGVALTGQARSHGEVERMASELARIPAVIARPAATERTPDGLVNFTLRLEKKEPGDGVGNVDATGGSSALVDGVAGPGGSSGALGRLALAGSAGG